MLEFSDVGGLRAVVYCLLLFCSMTLAVEQCVADVGLVASEKKPEARLVLLAACGVDQNCRKFSLLASISCCLAVAIDQKALLGGKFICNLSEKSGGD